MGVAGIEPASLAWKAKGYSRRFILLSSLFQNQTWNFTVIRLVYKKNWKKINSIFKIIIKKSLYQYIHNTYVSFYIFNM